MNHTQQRIYNYINALIKLNNTCVMLSVHNISEKLGLSEMTVRRNLEWLINNKHIYNAKLGNSFIYYTQPIDMANDFVCYVRNRV